MMNAASALFSLRCEYTRFFWIRKSRTTKQISIYSFVPCNFMLWTKGTHKEYVLESTLRIATSRSVCYMRLPSAFSWWIECRFFWCFVSELALQQRSRAGQWDCNHTHKDTANKNEISCQSGSDCVCLRVLTYGEMPVWGLWSNLPWNFVLAECYWVIWCTSVHLDDELTSADLQRASKVPQRSTSLL